MIKLKWLVTLILLVLAHTDLLACDVCGCTAGGNLMGILPQFHRNFGGIRFSERKFTTIHPPLFSYDSYQEKSVETYHTLDFWGRFYPISKVQVLGFVPVNSFSQHKDNEVKSVSGLGDIQLLANYTVFDNSDSMELPVKQIFLLGGGVKLPTGNSNLYRGDERLPQVIQLGSGSWDWSLNAIYTIRYKRLGLNLDALYKINGTNAQQYHFGNRFTASARLFYWARLNRLTFLPQLGVFGDAARPDQATGINQAESGGSSVLGIVGTDVYYKNWVISASLQPVLYQNIGLNYTTVHNRYMLSAVFLF